VEDRDARGHLLIAPRSVACHAWRQLVTSWDQENGMTIADLVYEQVKALPDHLAREVLDFVGYLRERKDRDEWCDLMSAQSTGLAAVWNNAEDEVWNNV
jgi:hypothetical protein